MSDMILGVDTAAKLTAKNCADLAAAGYAFVGRYLVPNQGATAWKALTREEAERITGAGLSILCVWETTETRARAGYSAGCVDGAQAQALAREIGMPEDAIIYFAVDYDAQKADFEAIREYLRGARQNSGPWAVGVYGGYSLIEYMAAYGACRGFWQTLAWSYGKLSEHRTVYQAKAQASVCGVAVDINECRDLAAAGIWTYAQKEADTVSITKAELEQLLAETRRQAKEEAIEAMKALLIGADTQPSDWAQPELGAAVADGITDGTRPQGYATRQEAALMCLRAMDAASMCGLDDGK